MPTQVIYTNKSSRSNMIQIFRAIAIIAVVMIHTTPHGHYQVICRPFINFSVATFLFLSGYLTKVENDNWPKFYKKRIIRVFIPYVIWTLLYTLAFHDIKLLPTNLLTTKAAVHLYYIFVYIQFVLLTPLIGKLAKSRYRNLGWLISPISVIIFKYYWLLTGQELNNNVDLIWSDSCLGWFTFYYLGLILGNKIIVKNYSLKVLSFMYLASIALQMLEGYGLLLLGDKNCGSQLKISSLLTSALFLLIIYAILKDGRFDIKNKTLRLIGDYSFGIFLLHYMVIKVLSIFFHPLYQYIPYPITAFIVVLLSLFCCMLSDRICSNKMSGWIGIR